MNLSRLVFDTLERDAQFREANNAEAWSDNNNNNTAGANVDLFKFDQIHFNREWDNSLPTLIKEYTYSKVRPQRTSAQAFRAAFFHDFAELACIDLSNVLIAGGCVGHYLINTRDKFCGDVDLFIYGLSREAADRRVCQLACELIAARKAALAASIEEKLAKKQTVYDSERSIEVKLIRNANGLSIFIGNQLYQIIFRLYKSKSEILHGFDIGSSAVGFTGIDVLFTTLSRFSYEFMCNIVDTTRRSTTYESRLEKYWQRGFGIILPYFNIDLLRKEYLKYSHLEFATLPCLVFGYSSVHGNQIVVKEFRYERASTLGSESDDADSVAKPRTDYALDDIDEYNVLYINLTHILNDPSKMYHFHTFEFTVHEKKQEKQENRVEGEEEEENEKKEEKEEEGEEGEEEASPKKKAKGEKKAEQDESATIRAFFDAPPYFSAKSINYFYGTLRRNLYLRKLLRIGMLEKYITVQSVGEITTRIFVNKENANAVLDDVVQRQEQHVTRLREAHATQRRPIQWLVQNPGTQLTSSINPIIEEPVKWYGTYYLPKKGEKAAAPPAALEKQ